jgi:hypothetical protein
MKIIAIVWNVRYRISPRPGILVSDNRNGIEIRTAVSINKAAYKNGSTARAEMSNDVITNPNEMDLEDDPEIIEPRYQKQIEEYKYINIG